ncbi:uncharacterized protein ColSpa_03204 [Colletotrichum spaethianum]|uniref:Uncharacterized protein n=1 Tax=Colletotrichum spaethianum TaxID=700344 RepID=A0AA37LB13_9PEZI|nr:uncharacterized protein ColSpa_03204 [Colletotrichum spaethianum]GKT43023.1 hypothetical protein ColSpa_03204 [Colletotrichum spaethianum]
MGQKRHAEFSAGDHNVSVWKSEGKLLGAILRSKSRKSRRCKSQHSWSRKRSKSCVKEPRKLKDYEAQKNNLQVLELSVVEVGGSMLLTRGPF